GPLGRAHPSTPTQFREDELCIRCRGDELAQTGQRSLAMLPANALILVREGRACRLDHVPEPGKARCHRVQVGEQLIRFPNAPPVLIEQDSSRSAGEDERVTALARDDQPVVLPILDWHAAEGVPAVAGLELPEAAEPR